MNIFDITEKEKDYILFFSPDAVYRNEIKRTERVYHYTRADNVLSILKENGVVLLLTKSDEFNDKSEGNYAIKKYYSAIKRLKNKSLITKGDYETLRKISNPRKRWLTKGLPNNTIHYYQSYYEAYIVCFSKEKSSKKMFKQYANKECALAFSMMGIDEEINKYYESGMRFEVVPVLYGKEIEKRFCEYILLIIDMTNDKIKQISEKEGDIKGREAYLIYNINRLINTMMFTSKKSKYSKEKEIRLVCYVPKNEDGFLVDDGSVKRIIKNNRQRLEWRMSRIPFIDIASSNSFNKEKEKEMRERIRHMGYSCEGYDS